MHLVMFDVDGTLCDTQSFEDDLYYKAIKDVLEIERPESLITFTHISDPGILVEMVMNSFDREITPKEFSAVRDHFSDMVMEKLMAEPEASPAIAGAVELFNQLKETENVMVAIATGGWGPTAAFKLATAGFDIERIVIATSDDDFDRKEIMKLSHERALKRVNLEEFKNITYVGDRPWDQQATEALGWRFVGVGEHTKGTKNWIADYTGVGVDHFICD